MAKFSTGQTVYEINTPTLPRTVTNVYTFMGETKYDFAAQCSTVESKLFASSVEAQEAHGKRSANRRRHNHMVECWECGRVVRVSACEWDGMGWHCGC